MTWIFFHPHFRNKKLARLLLENSGSKCTMPLFMVHLPLKFFGWKNSQESLVQRTLPFYSILRNEFLFLHWIKNLEWFQFKVLPFTICPLFGIFPDCLLTFWQFHAHFKKTMRSVFFSAKSRHRQHSVNSCQHSAKKSSTSNFLEEKFYEKCEVISAMKREVWIFEHLWFFQACRLLAKSYGLFAMISKVSSKVT